MLLVETDKELVFEMIFQEFCQLWNRVTLLSLGEDVLQKKTYLSIRILLTIFSISTSFDT